MHNWFFWWSFNSLLTSFHSTGRVNTSSAIRLCFHSDQRRRHGVDWRGHTTFARRWSWDWWRWRRRWWWCY